jgi:hypothetical protein
MRKNVLHTVFAAVMATAIVAPVVVAQESDEVVYSNEGYCVLANEGVADSYLMAYAKKLGMKPTAKECLSFKKIVEDTRPRDWDFPGGKPYPGSAIRLSAKQIELLKASRKAAAAKEAK